MVQPMGIAATLFTDASRNPRSNEGCIGRHCMSSEGGGFSVAMLFEQIFDYRCGSRPLVSTS